VDSRLGLDTVSRKIPFPRRESKPDHPVVQPVTSLYTHSALQALVRSLEINLIRKAEWNELLNEEMNEGIFIMFIMTHIK
jgi:hypothetical protein